MQTIASSSVRRSKTTNNYAPNYLDRRKVVHAPRRNYTAAASKINTELLEKNQRQTSPLKNPTPNYAPEAVEVNSITRLPDPAGHGRRAVSGALPNEIFASKRDGRRAGRLLAYGLDLDAATLSGHWMAQIW
ncbi:hypothetical protein EVAR_4767_1 [Eumeta japonica]|uniref:Uncharacterized protein n=1 Tax=Eumeta variegata TaxID=151549 RepID=A0A4C1SYW0_EUMVA|nr:hypothetical protein EVAR_4767_1 [Eumeta japonica]